MSRHTPGTARRTRRDHGHRSGTPRTAGQPGLPDVHLRLDRDAQGRRDHPRQCGQRRGAAGGPPGRARGVAHARRYVDRLRCVGLRDVHDAGHRRHRRSGSRRPGARRAGELGGRRDQHCPLGLRRAGGPAARTGQRRRRRLRGRGAARQARGAGPEDAPWNTGDQRLRAERDLLRNRVHHARRSGRTVDRLRADRHAAGQCARLRARPHAGSGTRGRDGRAVCRRGEHGPGLPRPRRTDRAAVRTGPVRPPGLADVPHR